MDKIASNPDQVKEPTPEQATLLRGIDDYRKMRERLIDRLLISKNLELPELDDHGFVDIAPVIDLQNTVEAFSIVARNLIRSSLRARESSPFVPVSQFKKGG